MKNDVYVDTSAYLCTLLGEDGSTAMARAMRNARLCSSVLLVLESRRNLIHMARSGQLAAHRLNDLLDRLQQDMTAFALRDLTLDLCQDPALPSVATPRSLDLAHLRTALWFHRRAPLGRFLTCDEGQREAARELGLPTG
ncbi:MAG: hypothetical protein JNN13_17290 [Planctomycetes bacterium]|nr:hypothetical protein [Planctomycetota bacterium]